jgi:hypothetical protein
MATGFHPADDQWRLLQVSFYLRRLGEREQDIPRSLSMFVEMEAKNSAVGHVALPFLVVGTRNNGAVAAKPHGGGDTLYGPSVHHLVSLQDSAAPRVVGGSLFVTGGQTPIAALTGGRAGQQVQIIAKHNTTIEAGNAIALSGGVDFDMRPDDTLTLVNAGGDKWVETGRSHNSPL